MEIAYWGSVTATNLVRILVMQKKTIRTILRLGAMGHCKPYFTKLNILTVMTQYVLETITLDKTSTTTLTVDQYIHNFRNSNNIDLPQHRLHKFSNTPLYIGSNFYNKLPGNIKSITNTKTFISKLKQYLNDRSYYTISRTPTNTPTDILGDQVLT